MNRKQLIENAGKEFRVIGNLNKSEDAGVMHNYTIGTIVTLLEDDGTHAPLFTTADGLDQYVMLKHLELA